MTTKLGYKHIIIFNIKYIIGRYQIHQFPFDADTHVCVRFIMSNTKLLNLYNQNNQCSNY